MGQEASKALGAGLSHEGARNASRSAHQHSSGEYHATAAVYQVPRGGWEITAEATISLWNGRAHRDPEEVNRLLAFSIEPRLSIDE
eukprot:6187558-Pleurochrysis_carterae.AAC.1